MDITTGLEGSHEFTESFESDNWTYDFDEVETFCDEEHEVDLKTFSTIFQPVFYSMILLFGVAGNGLMITVLLRRWRVLRITEIYLLHLALADLMLLFTLPFEVTDITAGWVFGNFLCKVNGLLNSLSFLCGSLLLACIGFDRYLAIVHAIPSMQCRRVRTVQLICIVLWLICFGLAIPEIAFLSVGKTYENSSTSSCDYHDFYIHGNNWVMAKRVLHHVCFFFPLAVMCYCYTALIITLWHGQKSQTKKGAIRLALLITIVFFICCLPYNVTLLIQTLVDLKLYKYETCRDFMLLKPVLEATKSLGILHCCLNPFLYAFVGVRFRNELIHLLCQLGCRRLCLPFLRAPGPYRPSISEGNTTVSSVLI
ncbi:C-X-C chemokine receptor type 5 [Mugil cephalus]|uniref:C-X-C chemokine receptor type 5 n=1 Tax=Mugil cephalus TaxID=48193 RepID=UPI001FB8159F|nr:C-X-C chemokine receptor type 5 [Mugil cephalus]